MSLVGRIYKKLIFKKYKKLKKIEKFHRSFGSGNRFGSLIRDRSDGLKLQFSHYTFSPHNPLISPDKAMRWICENYHAAFSR